jgi:hypothetical protein
MRVVGRLTRQRAQAEMPSRRCAAEPLHMVPSSGGNLLIVFSGQRGSGVTVLEYSGSGHWWDKQRKWNKQRNGII